MQLLSLSPLEFGGLFSVKAKKDLTRYTKNMNDKDKNFQFGIGTFDELYGHKIIEINENYIKS